MVGEELGRQGLEFRGLGRAFLLDRCAVADGVCWGGGEEGRVSWVGLVGFGWVEFRGLEELDYCTYRNYSCRRLLTEMEMMMCPRELFLHGRILSVYFFQH